MIRGVLDSTSSLGFYGLTDMSEGVTMTHGRLSWVAECGITDTAPEATMEHCKQGIRLLTTS